MTGPLRLKREPRDPRVRRRLFSWRMFLLILLVLLVLSATTVLILELVLNREFFSVAASMGAGTYWVTAAFLAAVVLQLVNSAKFDRPLRRLSRAMRMVAGGDFTVSLEPAHPSSKLDELDVIVEDFNLMVRELRSIETMKDDFIASVSHEIKTPLAVISSYAAALQRPDLPQQERAQYAETIASASEGLSRLVTNILRLSKLENQGITPRPAPYDLTRQLSDCALAHEEAWERKDIDFDSQLEERVMVMADESMMEIVFNNLIANAVKFTEDGGTIRFEASYLPGVDERHIVARYRIADTGVGMSEDFIGHIFDEFSQEESSARTQYKGTGLGMAITKRYVDLMGGTISVESQKGVGSTFTVELPMELTDDHGMQKQDYSADGSDLTGVKLLLAEDNDLNAEIATIQLEELGIRITRVPDGRQAVRAIAENPPGAFDVILMDIMMPELDGYAATAAIRALPDRPDALRIPIIAMTANAFAEDVQASMAAGMNGHLSKPIVMSEVVKTIARNLHT